MQLDWFDGEHGARDFGLTGRVRRVTGALWLPESYPPDTPVVLMGHGASGDRYQDPIPHLAKRFVGEAGFVVLAIDGPVHGLRYVAPGGREAFFAETKRASFVDDMVADWLDAVTAVQAEHQIGHGSLGYFGLSMGTVFGVPLLASRLNFTAAVIGLCGTTGAGAMVSDRLKQDAGKIDHPVSFLWQLEDELFPREGYLELFDALAAVDKRLHANPGLHPEVPLEEITHSFEFLRAHLSGKVERRVINPLAQ